MKPTLNVSSSIAQKLASIALHEQIQHVFRLHPSKIAKDLKRQAGEEGKFARELWVEVHSKVLQHLLPECLGTVVAILEERPVSPRQRYPHRAEEMIEYFGLVPNDLVEMIKEKAKLEGYSAAEAAEYLMQEAKHVFNWAFAETLRILIKEERE